MYLVSCDHPADLFSNIPADKNVDLGLLCASLMHSLTFTNSQFETYLHKIQKSESWLVFLLAFELAFELAFDLAFDLAFELASAYTPALTLAMPLVMALVMMALMIVLKIVQFSIALSHCLYIYLIRLKQMGPFLIFF